MALRNLLEVRRQVLAQIGDLDGLQRSEDLARLLVEPADRRSGRLELATNSGAELARAGNELGVDLQGVEGGETPLDAAPALGLVEAEQDGRRVAVLHDDERVALGHARHDGPDPLADLAHTQGLELAGEGHVSILTEHEVARHRADDDIERPRRARSDAAVGDAL